MGLIQAFAGSVSGVLADQWKEYFYSDALGEDVLVAKGQKRVSGRSSNTKGEDNVISDGSIVVVNPGQCMLIVDQGRIMEVCSEPGVYTYNTGTTPSIFAGNLVENLKGAAKDAWNRFQFGGGVGKDQKIYYVNTLNIPGNKYGTATPVPFKVVIDKEIGRSISINVRCNGEYAYHIVNPMIFFTKLCGNITNVYEREKIDSQLKSELLKKLQTALGKLSAKKIDYSEIPLYADELGDILNEELSKVWIEDKGIEIASFGINGVSVSEEDKQKIQRLEQTLFLSNPMLAGGYSTVTGGEASMAAASNTAGAMTGFMGMGMAGMAGGGAANASSLFAQGLQMQQMQMQQQQMQQQMQAAQPQVQPQTAQPQTGAAAGWTCACGATVTGKFCPECGSKKPEPKPAADAWTCACGATVTGKFCMECGAKRPEPAPEGWTCACGAVNKGKFCMECGAKKPVAAPLYKCDKCGWEPADPKNPPRFCPECGDIFNDSDIQ